MIVVVFVKDHINCKHRPDLQIGNLECIWLEIKIKNKKYLYGTFYIPPNSNLQTWGRNQLSVNESISWQDAAIRSNFGVILWIFKWRKETELCIKLLTVVEVEHGTFYIPPNSNLQTWDELDQSIDLALNNTHDIIITGDFNINQLSDNHRNKISSLLTQYSFQLISMSSFLKIPSQSTTERIFL
jgi:hypothetical protein